MSKDEALQAIKEGVSPSKLGQCAHRMEDWVCLGGGLGWAVKTPRGGWHFATDRELKLLRRA